jgi:putative membrane protein
MAIRNYTDHAANERTFLAWVRTSVAIVGFGFLVERFDLFIGSVSSKTKQAVGVPAEQLGHIAGLTLIVLGMAMIAVAAWRFRRTAREIDDAKTYPGAGSRTDLALALLLLLLCAGLLFYLFNALAAKA